MGGKATLSGVIISGVGQAAYFTGLAWVQEQCAEKLHFLPYAGTLNIRLDEESLFFLEKLKYRVTIELLSPTPNFCNARVLPACLKDLPVAVIMPDEKVTVHDRNIIEVIAHVHLKGALSLRDGDRVVLVFEKISGNSD